MGRPWPHSAAGVAQWPILPAGFAMTFSPTYPIGTPGQAWGPAEQAQWLARQVRQRSYANDVLEAVKALKKTATVEA